MLLSTLIFFDFSGGEFLLIAVVFLMFFGSKSIPGMARTLGKAMRDFKEAAGNVQREIQDSTKVEEIKEIVQPKPENAIQAPANNTSPDTSPETLSQNKTS